MQICIYPRVVCACDRTCTQTHLMNNKKIYKIKWASTNNGTPGSAFYSIQLSNGKKCLPPTPFLCILLTRAPHLHTRSFIIAAAKDTMARRAAQQKGWAALSRRVSWYNAAWDLTRLNTNTHNKNSSSTHTAAITNGNVKIKNLAWISSTLNTFNSKLPLIF